MVMLSPIVLAHACLLLGFSAICCVNGFSFFRKIPVQPLKLIAPSVIITRSWRRETLALCESLEADGGSTFDQNISKNAYMKAERLRERARELKAEARAMEATMTENRIKSTIQRKVGQDSLIAELFGSNETASMLAEKIRQERWSPENLVLIVERIHERQIQAMGKAYATSPTGFQIGDTRNSAESNRDEYNLLEQYAQLLIDATSLLDDESRSGTNINFRWTGRVSVSLSSKLNELRRVDDQAFQKRLSLLTSSNEIKNDPKESIQDFTKQSMGVPEGIRSPKMNTSAILEMSILIPKWFPRSIIPLYSGINGKLDPKDIKSIEKDVLAGTEFYCTSTESISYAALFRGNIRPRVGAIESNNETTRIFEDIISKLESNGLSHRVQLFLLNDPEWRPNRLEPMPKPVIVALSTAVLNAMPAPRQSRLAKFSSLFSLFLSFIHGVSCYALNEKFFSHLPNNAMSLGPCFSIFAGLISIQAIHEVAHRIFAARTGTKIGFPVLLPSTQLGTFGSITRLHSFPRDRTAFFDFSISGPFAGMLASIASLVAGVVATVHASADALSSFPVSPAVVFKSSYLTGSLISSLAPKLMLLPFSQPVPMHPLFFIGFAGLISNALNILPIGRLDGGRAYTAVFGSRSAAHASTATLIFLVLMSISGESSLSLYWGAMVVLFQRNADIPVRNELPEVDDVRVGLYLGVLALALASLAPFPGGLGTL